jgi:hypothetical protein
MESRSGIIEIHAYRRTDSGCKGYCTGIQRQRIFPLASVFRPAVRPIQPPIQFGPGSFPGVKRGRGVTLTSHSHHLPRSKMSTSYTSSPLKACKACSRQLKFFCRNLNAPKALEKVVSVGKVETDLRQELKSSLSNT